MVKAVHTNQICALANLALSWHNEFNIDAKERLHMEITRYDGTRFLTEEDVDREFTGQWVLLRIIGAPYEREGYLVASADGIDELRPDLEDIAITEFDSNAKILYGCKSRGGSLHVELLG
jgi:hypothetical protein